MKRTLIITIVLMLAIVSAASAQEVDVTGSGDSITYGRLFYYGDEVTHQELEQTLLGDQHCVQQVDSRTRTITGNFNCFNTLAEADAYLTQTLKLLRRQQGPSTNVVCQGGYWNLYAYSLYSGYITTLNYGQSIANTSIWSVWRYCVATPLRVWDQPNFQGNSYTIVYSQITMIEGFAFRSARYPA